MASNLQLKATLVPPTGTGKLMVPYRIDGDAATYRISGGVTGSFHYRLKRTEPKPTKTFPGSRRGEVKTSYTVTHPTTGVVGQVVITTSSAIPDWLDKTASDAAVTDHLLSLSETESKDHLSVGSITQ